MSRTRFIYFLSAIVLIIGCFALNTSYSLFVDNDSTQLVETTVPTITDEVTLSLSSVEVEGTKEYIIKQTITNNNSIPMGFRLIASSDSTTYQVQSTKYKTSTIVKEDGTEEDQYENYYSYGTVEANSTTDVYLRVANINEDTTNIATINFSLESDYATLKMNTDEYLARANVDNDAQYEITIISGGAPYNDNTNTLAYKLIEKQMTKFGSTIETNSEGSTNLNDAFSNNNKVPLPITIPGELNVPSPTEFTDVATTDVGLYKAEDDYGTSYYYRGANDYNYVNFAGFTWRIVRINGDGSIRLILDGSLNKVTHNGTSVYLNKKLKALDSDGNLTFKSSPYNDNAYIGYMFGDFETNSTSYDDAHENIKDSTIKTYVDAFYEEYLASYQNEYLADTLFCGDKTRATGYTTLGFGTGSNNITYYGAYDRLYKSSTLSTPTLECASSEIVADSSLTEEQLAYSRYTSIIDENTRTTKGVLINNSLKYPIGLLSADELVMAGAFRSKKNTSYYLYDAYGYETPMLYQRWWTISSENFTGSYANVFNSNTLANSLSLNTIGSAYGVRPVINLKAEMLVDDGVGTYGSPYTVKINEEA